MFVIKLKILIIYHIWMHSVIYFTAVCGVINVIHANSIVCGDLQNLCLNCIMEIERYFPLKFKNWKSWEKWNLLLFGENENIFTK